MNAADLVVPGILAATALWGLWKRVDLYGALTDGGKQGLKTAVGILPSLCIMLTAVAMFRASGAMEALTALLAPVLERVGIPAECTSLMLVRPMSFSGALAAGTTLMEQYGPDSVIGRTAAVMLGSTETTFYAAAVYLSAARKKAGAAIPAALAGDLAGFFTASLMVHLLFR